MANKIGSEFIEDFELEKGGVLKNTRFFIFWLGMLLGLVVTLGVIVYELPDLIYQVFDGLVVLPMCCWGLSLDEKLQIKERFYFLTLETIRTYGTESDNKERR